MLALFIFPTWNIVVKSLAVIASPQPVAFPFNVFLSGDFPSVKLLLAQGYSRMNLSKRGSVKDFAQIGLQALE
ncbi:hypothetical protein [Lawsonibacter hominis]|uniref:hypothetical protein n=1 Tax=Lawsonibacter hominis TaxID=2763053 RepID=UPI003329E61B